MLSPTLSVVKNRITKLWSCCRSSEVLIFIMVTTLMLSSKCRLPILSALPFLLLLPLCCDSNPMMQPCYNGRRIEWFVCLSGSTKTSDNISLDLGLERMNKSFPEYCLCLGRETWNSWVNEHKPHLSEYEWSWPDRKRSKSGRDQEIKEIK